ncbi:Na/Pi cotransporter family protein [Sansalvadorimonas verongulae]|uniref:Na/Pi cotransporter family protein n=1 Tax=Sansalvadorimonas verongulae TaxID=2172824 RepID=UPI0012BC8ABD|nr:Na/Pi symporter [Sansalvadorimonas verongulae]MTI15067.1 Na/Pi cotransporter family protein [Sansalvadorimonas verongulae]
MFRKLFFTTITLLLIFSFLFHPDILTVIAGISMFLFGMLCLEQGFREASGGLLSRVLRKTTRNRWSSYLTGVVSTSVLQSSSLSSVITVSFVSTGLISLSMGIALVVGAGLGSTAGTWLMAAFGMKVAISHYAMPLLVMGTLLQLQNNRRSKGTGYVLLGIGFLFLGIHYIRNGMSEAGDLSLLTTDYGLLGGVLAGTLLTVLMQSSHALLVLVIAAMANGLIGFEQSLALCIGTNIGTTATAALASISANSNGRRLALANALVKVITGLLILVTFPLWTNLTQSLSSTLGVSDSLMLQLALFHSLFNIMSAILTLPALTALSNALSRLFQDKTEHNELEIPLPDQQPARAQLLTSAALQHPDAALIALETEARRLYRRSVALIGFGLYVENGMLYTEGDNPLPESVPPWPNWRIGKLYKLQIRGLHEDICDFCDQLEPMVGPEQKASILAIRTACDNFVSAIKHLRVLQKSLRRHIRNDTPQVRKHYWLLRNRIIATVRRIRTLSMGDENIARAISELKTDIYRQDLLTGDSLSKLLEEGRTSALHTTAMINDNGTAHDICNSMIDGAVILMLQGESSILRLDPSAFKAMGSPLWQHQP